MIKTSSNFMNDYIFVEYEIFTTCNKKCSYCYNMNHYEDRNYETSEYIISNISKIITNDKIILQLIGGEPILHKNFNEIINFIYDNKKEDLKLTIFTHADHNNHFFEKKLFELIKFGNKAKINCSLHFEDINFKQYEDNILFLDKNFSEICIFILVDDNFMTNYDWFKELINKTSNVTFLPLFFDESKSNLDFFKQLKYFNKLKDIINKNDCFIIINDKKYFYSEGKLELFKKNKFSFLGNDCKIKYYEINKSGDIRLACNRSIIENLKNLDKINNFFVEKQTICKEKTCQKNLITSEMKHKG